MAEWIEIPAHRVLKVSRLELRRDFQLINENGMPVKENDLIYRIIRHLDEKMFKLPRYHCWTEFDNDFHYLEEI